MLASQLRVRTLIFRAGRIPDNDTPDRARLEELLADLAMFGNHLGVVPTITPSDDSAETLLELTGKISSGPIGIDFDPAGFAINRRKPEERCTGCTASFSTCRSATVGAMSTVRAGDRGRPGAGPLGRDSRPRRR